MPYNPQFLNDINRIIIDLDTNNLYGPGEALDKFKIYLQQIKSIGIYNPNDWHLELTEKIYEFGNRFKKINPTQFLTAINFEIATSSISEKEILNFLKIEILWNFDNPTKHENFLIDLLNIYYTNAEFLHNLGHIKQLNGQFKESIECYGQALKISTNNTKFTISKYSAEINYIEHLIETENYDLADEVVNAIISSNIYNNTNFVIHNWFIFLKNRIKDYKLQDKKNSKRELDLKTAINSELLSERKRTIELLGLFTAIIAFIFTTVSISKTFEYTQALTFITCLGLILILFSLTISILFQNSNSPFYFDVRLYLFLFLSIFLYCLVSSSTIFTFIFKFLFYLVL